MLNNTHITDAALKHFGHHSSAGLALVGWNGCYRSWACASHNGNGAELAHDPQHRRDRRWDTSIGGAFRTQPFCRSGAWLGRDGKRDSTRGCSGAAKLAIKATKALQKAAPKATATVTPAEIDVAKDVLYSFFKAMNEWHSWCVERNEAAKRLSATGHAGDEIWEECRERCREIFSRYCTQKTRAYGRPENISIGSTPDYEADPDQEPITSIDTPSRQRFLIETKQKFIVHHRCQYVLLKQDGQWRIDSKKIWSSAAERASGPAGSGRFSRHWGAWTCEPVLSLDECSQAQ